MSQTESKSPRIVLNPLKFKDQVAVITGSAQGIGQVVATLFAEQGASVVLLDLNKEKLQQVEETLLSNGLTVSHRVCDLTDENQVHKTINEIVQTLGKIDILAHLAGIYPAKPLLEVTTAEYRKIFQINMDSCFFLTQAILPHMQKQGYGRIINTASQTIVKPEPGLGVYAASKSAVAGFTRATATEAGPGVTANFVSPTLIATDTTLSAAHAKPLFAKIVDQQYVKRTGLPQDVAHAIMYIASPEAEFITGQMFDIGGGSFFH
jgi:NAD(P)-dependent dehydrogenase (short-subunit alcohol dehydrogenase family)